MLLIGDDQEDIRAINRFRSIIAQGQSSQRTVHNPRNSKQRTRNAKP
jgi:hypothetical protein